MPTRIGFIGLGPLGYNIARNIAANPNNSVLLWNRTIEKAHQLRQEVEEKNKNVSVAEALHQLVNGSDVIFTCLANDEIVKKVYTDMLNCQMGSWNPDAPSPEKLLVDCSTVYPTTAVQLNEMISSIFPGGSYIASPVLGGPPVAAKAQLVALMSGNPDKQKLVADILVPTAARRAIYCGKEIQKAPTAKLIVNSMVIGTVEVLAESFTLAEKSGVGTETIHEAVKEILPAPTVLSYSDKLVSRNFDGSQGFNLQGAIKDSTHVRQLSSDNVCPMPVIDIAYEHIITTSKLEGGVLSMDWTAVIDTIRAEAGLERELGPKL